MTMIGIELADRRAIAVAVAADGRVLARGEASEADPIDAVRRALKPVMGQSGHESALIAVASLDPESAASSDVLKGLAGLVPGTAVPKVVVASGTAAAAAEAWVGAARGERNVVFFGVAEHAVAGILRQGEPLTGTTQRAPAVAWLALNPVEREDYRKVGCLEAEVAAAGIVRRLIWRIKAGDLSRVLDAAKGDLAAITLEHVLEAARQGDGVAISVMRDTAKYLGMGGANLAAVADPEVLVLGGIVASAPDLLLEPVRTEMIRRLPPAVGQALKIVAASLGADAPAIGAVRLAAAAPR